MFKLILAIVVLSINLLSQTFIVEKVNGKVLVQRGTNEKWEDVKSGNKLSSIDLVATGENSYVQLSNDGKNFLLKSNSAINLGSIKKISLNDLLLALTAEEVKYIPRQKNNSNVKSTAVYGTENNGKKSNPVVTSDLGIKKINGARQLAEVGFKESAVLVAKDAFRKYPETQQLVSDRIYFADLLVKLSLYEEAYAEYRNISSLKLSEKQKELVNDKLKLIAQKLP
ncbi:MAG: hypothetical protein NTX22_08980 [Ignavibacteriales bacterium]|nr:hypothetical protein [Ignavibacteriales bacterium]